MCEPVPLFNLNTPLHSKSTYHITLAKLTYVVRCSQCRCIRCHSSLCYAAASAAVVHQVTSSESVRQPPPELIIACGWLRPVPLLGPPRGLCGNPVVKEHAIAWASHVPLAHPLPYDAHCWQRRECHTLWGPQQGYLYPHTAFKLRVPQRQQDVLLRGMNSRQGSTMPE